MAQRREADAGHQADVAGADDADAVLGGGGLGRGLGLGQRLGNGLRRLGGGHGVDSSMSTGISVGVRFLGSLARLRKRVDLAISWMVFAVSELSRELEIQ